MKICSLLPTATEMLYALGCGRFLVARSEHCVYPPQAKRKPVVVTSQVKKIASQDSLAIHRTVQTLSRQGTHQFTVDVKRLRRLKPDLVVTQNLCSVCAASHSEVLAALQYLSPRPQVISLEAQRLEGVFTDLRKLASFTGRERQAERIIHRMASRIEAVRAKVAGASHRPRVWCCEWLQPPMAAGHWIPDLVELAGGMDGLGTQGANSAWLSWGRVRAYHPEVILVMPCSYSIPQTVRERYRLTRRPGWKELPAVRKKRVYALQGELFHHAGPRLVDGLELFAHLLHPELVPAGPHRRRFRPLL